MIKSDLITKMLDTFRKAMEEIENLINEQKFEAAIQLIDDTLSDLFRLNLKSFNSLSDEYLLEIIKVKDLVDADRLIIISALLQREAYIFELQGNENYSHFIHTKALNLRLSAIAINDEPELISYYEEIPALIEKTATYEFSAYTCSRLIEYNEILGDYAQVENLLYDLLESTSYNQTTLTFAIDFYERLLKFTDENLEKGGLPRDEIETALTDLKNK